MKSKSGYKLLRLRKNGTIGPLFINKTMIVPVGKWLKAETFPTKGYAVRKGWHCCVEPTAPHLTMNGRVWCKVSMRDVVEYTRPKSQGGLWLLANYMRVDEILKGI
jgi:hypothetical protein